MIDRIKANFKSLFRYFLAIWSSLSALAGVVLTFISWEDMGITSRFTRLLILCGIVLIAVIGAAIAILCRNNKRIFGDINKGMELCYGDIIRIGFPKKGQRRIVVIPVNRCFDLSCEGNLISRRSIHGQWIEKYIGNDNERVQLTNKIQQILSERGEAFDLLCKADKCDGNLKRYRPGTVVELAGKKNVSFYLLALSEFDKGLRAHCSEADFYAALQGLLEYYDIHGMSEDMYCPVMGDHIVRPTRGTNDIISLMLSVFRFNREKIHGRIHVVVYDKMKSEIPILDY